MWFAEFGVCSLIASLCFSLMLVVIPSLGVYRHQRSLINTAQYYAVAQWLFTGLAFALLTVCFLRDDFSVWYVRMNSSIKLPWFYKACAVWGGHEGSMLLWVLILQTWTLAVALLSRRLTSHIRSRILVVLGVLSVGFLLFVLTTSNPFLRNFEDLPSLGRDLNPLLQDPGFLFHPPVLYMGYVGFSVAFAAAITLLWVGKFDQKLITWMRPWTLAAWCCLTLGITLGSWWAYRELGWGGFWFWDPVENASFMPWLAGTALIHSQLVAEKRRALVAWVLLLSILVFALSLVGTFLVRSGVLTSVHAFAVDPQRGEFILGFLMLVVGGSLSLFAWRGSLLSGTIQVALVSREMVLLLNNVLLVVAMVTVLLGTLYPLLIEGLGLGKLSVGAPYFNTVFVPLMLPLFGLMGIGLNLSWRKDHLKSMWRRLRWIFLFVLLSAIMAYRADLTTALGIAFSLWIVLTTLQYARATRLKTLGAWSVVTSHLGVAVTAIGITCSTGLGEQLDASFVSGQTISFAGHAFQLLGESSIVGPNYHGTRADFLVDHVHLYPEKRVYDVGQIVMTDAAIDVNPLRDIYIALGEPLDHQGWSVRLYDKPLVRWIWAGGFLMCLGGGLALCRCVRKKSD